MAALTINAAASEIRLFPTTSFPGIFVGNSSLMLGKGRDKLIAGDIPGAEELLKAFEKSVPEGSSALFAAEIKAAKGDHGAAAELLRRAAAEGSASERASALLYLADEAFRKNNWISAFAFCKAAEQHAVSHAQKLLCRTGILQSLLNAGLGDETLLVLRQSEKDFPGEKELWERFAVAAAGARGAFGELISSLDEIKEKFPPAPDQLLFDGFFRGGEAAMAEKSPDAEKLFARAYDYAGDDAGRRNCLRKLITLQKDTAPERALKTIERYLLYFPKASDIGSIRLIQGKVLASKKEFLKALDIFRTILSNGKYRTEERLSAALEAAFVSERLGDLSMARELYNSAIRRFGSNPEYASRTKMHLLEFLVRTKDYSPAVLLGDELAGVREIDQDKLNLLRLAALVEMKRYADALLIAGSLAGSRDPGHAAAGTWQLARLNELQKEFGQARELYLDFVKKFPGDEKVPDALLAAADFALKQRKYQEAANELGDYLKKFPAHSGVRKGLLAALFAALRCTGDDVREKAELIFKRLETEFPESDEYDQAVMELSRYYRSKQDLTAAFKLLERFLSRRPRSGTVPAALLAVGAIFENMGSHQKALEYVDRLLDKYPASPLAVEAAMLGGSCCFQWGNYRRALEYYERACELGGRGMIAQIAAGEAADCHLMLRNKKNLLSAIRIYRELASRSEFAALQAQALYKLGIAWEYNGDNMKALEAYEELLALAVSSEKMRRSSGVAPWCARAARSALRIILGAPHLPDGSQRAQRVYRFYALLDLPGSSEELKKYLEEIRKHYNLLD